MKNLFLFILLLACSPAHAACEKPFIFFDLGQTIVDTDTNKYDPMFYFRLDGYSDSAQFPTAKEYIDALVKSGYQVGLIVDIPGEWGLDYPADNPIRDLTTAKVVRTMDFIAGIIPEDGASWQGEPMDWTPFVKITGEGADRKFTGTLLLPQNNSERKGNGSTVLFERAFAMAKATGCPAIYQGENEKEMELARKAGLEAFWVGHTIPGKFFRAW